MADELTDALAYAARDPKVWLDRPAYQQRYIKALAHEVLRQQREIEQLQDVLAVQDAQFQDERSVLKEHINSARHELELLREEAERPPSDDSHPALPLQKWGPKVEGHPTIGTKCAACEIPFKPGDFTTGVTLGPGDDRAAREAASRGKQYVAVAIEVHWSCATGTDP